MRNPKRSRGEWCWCPNVAVLEHGGVRSSNIALFTLVLGSVSIHVRQYARSICEVHSIVVVVFIDTIGI